MKPERPPALTKQMRAKLIGEIGKVWPEEAGILMKHLEKKCKDKGLVCFGFQVNDIPISLNHMYAKGQGSEYTKEGTAGAFKDKQGRWRKKSSEFRLRLRPEVHQWRALVAEAMEHYRWKWKPTGITAAIILFESPSWITAKRTVRQSDVDNKAKPAIDAVQEATGIADELHWQLHLFKVQAKRNRTTIFLYDLGDVVEYYY